MSGESQDQNQVSSQTLDQALALFVDKWRTRWYPDGENIRGPFQRIFYTGSGAFSVFLLWFLLSKRPLPQEVANFYFFGDINLEGLILTFIPTIILPTLFFSFLVGYVSERRGGPISLYLDGVLLPVTVMLLVTLPMWLRGALN